MESVESVHNFSKNLLPAVIQLEPENINLILFVTVWLFMCKWVACASFTFACHDDSAERLAFKASQV